MADRSAELARAWLAKARHDLENARLLILQEKRLLDIAAYHCQQAAEKALKAYLTAKDCVFPKTHILETLLASCIPFHSSFATLQSACEKLTPLAGANSATPATSPSPRRRKRRTHCAWRKKSIAFANKSSRGDESLSRSEDGRWELEGDAGGMKTPGFVLPHLRFFQLPTTKYDDL